MPYPTVVDATARPALYVQSRSHSTRLEEYAILRMASDGIRVTVEEAFNRVSLPQELLKSGTDLFLLIRL
jgi:hypothetical protein